MARKNAAVVCFVFAVAMLLVQINLSAFWRLKLMHKSRTPPHNATNRRSIIKRGPLVQQRQQRDATSAITCDRSHEKYDICSISAPTLLDPTTRTFFLADPPAAAAAAAPSPPEKIRPHPRKWEESVMSGIHEFSLTTAPAPGPCDVVHPVPALMFSIGGYIGNYFHEFNDAAIPLFITVQTVYSGSRDFVLVIENVEYWWLKKYADLLARFSKHPVVVLNSTTGGTRHCFPSATIGLITHGFMTIDPQQIPNSADFPRFRELLAGAYGDRRKARSAPAKNMGGLRERRPRLVFALRSKGVARAIVNHEEVRKAMEAIGFEVVVLQAVVGTPLKEVYTLMNSSHALIGVHGAALTNSLFLRPRAVFVQIMPLGTEWLSEVCFGQPARALGLDYMEYKMGVDESSLTEKYGRDSRLVKDPTGIQANGWSTEVMDIYLKQQNVRVDLTKFDGILKKAYVRAKKFMEEEG